MALLEESVRGDPGGYLALPIVTYTGNDYIHHI